jgi:hypothetical protein
MRAPLCICNGVIRSGSTWSFNVCRVLLQDLGRQRNQPSGSCYLEAVQLEGFITQHWNKAPGPTIIKAHQVGPLAYAAIRSGEAKAVCTFRDPRDCIASDLVFMRHGIEAAVQRVVLSLEFLRYFQATDYILLVRYEHMMTDRRREIRRIADHLGVLIDSEILHRIDAQTNLQAARNICDQLKAGKSERMLNVASHRVDAATHVHENHIDSAAVGRWKTELSAEQGRWLTEFFASWLLNLGYETQESLKAIISGSKAQPSAMEGIGGMVAATPQMAGASVRA